MQSNRGVKGYLVKYLILGADLTLCCDLVLLLKQRMKLGLDTCFCTVIISDRAGFSGGKVGVKLILLAVLRHTAYVLSAEDLQTCRALKESKSNCKALSRV